jgi:hypothetical protein
MVAKVISSNGVMGPSWQNNIEAVVYTDKRGPFKQLLAGSK